MSTSNIDSRFAAFSEGFGAADVSIEDQQHTVGEQQAMAPVPTINGEVAGLPLRAPIALRLDQLEVVAVDTLYSQWVLSDDDPKVKAHAESLAAIGDKLPEALIVWPTDHVKVVGGRHLVMYQVLHDPYLFSAWMRNKNTSFEVPCSIPEVADKSEALLGILSRYQHRRPQSLLEKVDLVRHFADDMGKTYKQIALHLAFDTSDGEPPSEDYVGQLYAIAFLPEPVRQQIHQGVILFSHARELCRLTRDTTNCIRAARLATQDSSRMPVTELGSKISGFLKGNLEFVEQGRRVAAHPTNKALRLVKDKRGPRPMTFYATRMVAPERNVIQVARRYESNITLIPGRSRSETAITPQSIGVLTAKLNSAHGPMLLRDLEAEVTGFLEAAHRMAVNQNLTNAEGLLAEEEPTLDEDESDMSELLA